MRLLPVLKPAVWDGPDRGARAHVWIGTPETPLAYVAYAWESHGDLTYVTHQTDDNDDPDEIVRQAFANLEEYESGFELVESNGSRLLVSAGRPFAAERVLCESYMVQVHEALDADEVVVSVPARGSVLATTRSCSPEARNTLVSLHREAWATASDERITDQLVVFKVGLKTATLSVAADGTVDNWH